MAKAIAKVGIVTTGGDAAEKAVADLAEGLVDARKQVEKFEKGVDSGRGGVAKFAALAEVELEKVRAAMAALPEPTGKEAEELANLEARIGAASDKANDFQDKLQAAKQRIGDTNELLGMIDPRLADFAIKWGLAAAAIGEVQGVLRDVTSGLNDTAKALGGTGDEFKGLDDKLGPAFGKLKADLPKIAQFLRDVADAEGSLHERFTQTADDWVKRASGIATEKEALEAYEKAKAKWADAVEKANDKASRAEEARARKAESDARAEAAAAQAQQAAIDGVRSALDANFAARKRYGDQVAVIEASTLSETEKHKLLTAALAELKTAIDRLTPAAEAVVKPVESVSAVFDKLAEAQKVASNAIGAVLAQMGPSTGDVWKPAQEAVDAYGATVVELADALHAEAVAAADQQEATESGTVAIQAQTVALKEAADAARAKASLSQSEASSIEQTIAKLREKQNAGGGLTVEEYGQLTDAENSLSSARFRAAAAAAEAAQASGAAGESNLQYAASAQHAADAADVATEVAIRAQRALEGQINAALDAANATNDQVSAQQAAEQSTISYGGETASLAEVISEVGEKATIANASVADLGRTTDAAAGGVIQWRDELGKLHTETLGPATSATEGLAAATADVGEGAAKSAEGVDELGKSLDGASAKIRDGLQTIGGSSEQLGYVGDALDRIERKLISIANILGGGGGEAPGSGV